MNLNKSEHQIALQIIHTLRSGLNIGIGALRENSVPFRFFFNKEDYEDDTDKNKNFTDHSRTVNDDCVRNLNKEQENGNDKYSKENSSVVNITNESKLN